MGPQTVLETPRLALRALAIGDLDFVAAMLDHPEVMRYYPQRYSRAGALEWIHRQLARYARDGHGLWLATERTSGIPVGQIGLSLQEVDGRPQPEIGYLLHRPFWGNGYATEGAAAVRDAAFSRWDYPRVISLIRPDNLPSRLVAGRIGMTEAGRTIHAGLEHLVFAVTRLAS